MQKNNMKSVEPCDSKTWENDENFDKKNFAHFGTKKRTADEMVCRMLCTWSRQLFHKRTWNYISRRLRKPVIGVSRRCTMKIFRLSSLTPDTSNQNGTPPLNLYTPTNQNKKQWNHIRPAPHLVLDWPLGHLGMPNEKALTDGPLSGNLCKPFCATLCQLNRDG